jgi:hypothetical protein
MPWLVDTQTPAALTFSHGGKCNEGWGGLKLNVQWKEKCPGRGLGLGLGLRVGPQPCCEHLQGRACR